MTQPIQEIIEQRYSCRSYIDEPIQEIHRQALHNFIIDTPDWSSLGKQVYYLNLSLQHKMTG